MNRIILAALVLLSLGSTALAEDFPLEQWLEEPDVKLVAVEFYADWCEPCKKAAPQWEALRKRYASEGLKLVVVNISKKPNAAQGCSKLPWNPDESLCDPRLGERLGVKTLPEAFLWSWQGNLLVERGQHVAEIETVIRRYLNDNPRVQIVATKTDGSPDRRLQAQVAEALSVSNKLTVVADAEMRKRLAKVRKESHAAARRDDQQCALAAEVSPNSILRVERFQGAVSLTLVDAVTGCQRAVASVPWNASQPRNAIKKVTFKLMTQLKRPNPQLPGAAQKRLEGPIVIRDQGEWDPTQSSAKRAIVTFDSSPQGAMVTVDGASINCQKTRCTKAVMTGRRTVTMTLADHVTRTEQVNLTEGTNLAWTLQPNYGLLNLTSEPAGLTVNLDGQPLKTRTPSKALKLSAGPHIVSFESDCYRRDERQFELERGQTVDVNLTPAPRYAAIEVLATDSDANALRATVSLDGRPIGSAYSVHKFWRCAKTLEITAADHAPWRLSLGAIKIPEYSKVTVQAVLKKTPVKGRTKDVKVVAGTAAPEVSGTQESPLVVTAFESNPPGASVFVDGEMVCDATPCSRVVHRGQRLVKFMLEDHVPWEKRQSITTDTAVNQTLTPNFSSLSVTSQPSGLPLYMDGKVLGKTPIRGMRVAAGEHMVWVGGSNESAECFLREGRAINLKRGQHWTAELTPKPLPSAIDVTARNERGDDVAAEVWVDGAFVGRAPGLHKVPVCTKRVEVRHPDLAPAVVEKLALKPKVTSPIAVTLAGSSVEIKTSKPGAMITLDGRFIGPSNVYKALRPGTYTVAVDDPCYQRREKKIVVKRGKRLTVKLDLKPQTGQRCAARGFVTIGGLTPMASVWVEGNTVDGRAIANGDPIAVTAGRPIRIRLSEPDAFPWSEEVTVEEGAVVRLTPNWSTVGFVGTHGDEDIRLRPVNGEGTWSPSGVATRGVRLPRGTFDITIDHAYGATRRRAEGRFEIGDEGLRFTEGPWTRDHVPQDAEGRAMITLPGWISIASTVDGLFAHRGDGHQVNLGVGGFFLVPGHEARLTVGSPRHLANVRLVSAKPGDVTVVGINEDDLTIHPEWERYESTESMQVWSWVLMGSAGGAGVLAGVLGSMMSGKVSEADAAYASYHATQSLAEGQLFRDQATTLDDEAATLGAAVGVVSAIAAGALAGAIYMLVTNPTTAPPGAIDNAMSVQPWMGSDGGGWQLQGRF